jgi:DNA-binding NarL/FixJ family response regulator
MKDGGNSRPSPRACKAPDSALARLGLRLRLEICWVANPHCERELIRLVGLGMFNAEIAVTVYIALVTAKAHVARPLPKLETRNGYSSSSPPATPARIALH